jgi:hypothetical protein
MPEQEDLELPRALRSALQHDQLKQPAQSQVDERPAHTQPPKSGRAKPSIREPTPLSEPEPSSEPHAWLNFASRSRMRARNGCRSPSCIRRLRACWATHRPSGWEVQATYSIRRVASEMKNRT